MCADVEPQVERYTHLPLQPESTLDKRRSAAIFTLMALTPSTMLPLGTAAPDFRLPDVNGKMIGLSDFKAAPALVVLFICNHCPFVKHIRSGLADFGRDAQKRGAAVVAINANDPAQHPEDHPQKMKLEAESRRLHFSLSV